MQSSGHLLKTRTLNAEQFLRKSKTVRSSMDQFSATPFLSCSEDTESIRHNFHITNLEKFEFNDGRGSYK